MASLAPNREVYAVGCVVRGNEHRGPRRTGPIVRATLVVLATAWSAACAPNVETLLDRRLTDGRHVRDLIAPNGPHAILVYKSSTCFACGTPLNWWRDLGRMGRVKVILVLTGPATEADLRNLRIQRVPVAGVLDEPPIPSERLPGEYVIENGELLARAEGARKVASRRLWMRFASDSFRRPVNASGR